MNTLPLITFVSAIALCTSFEVVWAWIAKRWHIPLDREMWSLLFWAVAVVLLVTTGLMSVRPRPPTDWAPFFAVAAIHVFVCLFGGEFYRITPINPPDTNGAGSHSNPNSNAESKDLIKKG